MFSCAKYFIIYIVSQNRVTFLSYNNVSEAIFTLLSLIYQHIFPGCINASIIIGGDYGSSMTESENLRLNSQNKICLYESYAGKCRTVQDYKFVKIKL